MRALTASCGSFCDVQGIFTSFDSVGFAIFATTGTGPTGEARPRNVCFATRRSCSLARASSIFLFLLAEKRHHRRCREPGNFSRAGRTAGFGVRGERRRTRCIGEAQFPSTNLNLVIEDRVRRRA
jgi:hypothetical protein